MTNKSLAQTHIDNLAAAIVFWGTVPEEYVDLSDWNCGTHACLGGWLEKGGIIKTATRKQYMYGHHEDWMQALGRDLLGSWEIFAPRSTYRENDHTSDHQVAANRLWLALGAAYERLES